MQNRKQQKLNQLERLLRQPETVAGVLDTEIDNLKAYQDIDLEALREYARRQMQEEQRLAASKKEQEALPLNPFSCTSESQLREIIARERGIVVLAAKLELARRDFFEYCHLLAPRFYRRDRPFLIRLCRELQAFWGAPDETVMIINLPPRHGKSRTAGMFSQWVYGERPETKIMTGSYNETLSTQFSKTVRNGIQEEKAEPGKLVFSDIFPGVKIKRGDGAMNLWSLEGQCASYLATSPGGTATGFGGTLIIVDDLIKSHMEAFNDDLLDGQWQWFTDTMLSRLEEGGKIILIMTRWASRDLAGRAKEYFTEQGLKVREVVMRAVQDDGSMLCPSILSRESYGMKTKAMSEEIASANYQQIPVDIKGRLYAGFKTYSALPVDERGKDLCTGSYNYTDTADTGADYLCSINYREFNGEAYITNIIYTKDGMEVTEPAVAEMLDKDRVNVAEIESNNGGRGFARNVQTLLRQRGNRRCVVKWFHQGQNKKARILTNATWVMEHIYFPVNWRDRWPEFYRAMTAYQRAGKNAHDDAPDAVTGIAERFTKPMRRVKFGRKGFGL